MAIQNFLSGGFYGKLGAVVGQRWKNIRTIRVYVIPNDPKTPAQLAMRNRFRLEVFASQAGLRINPRCTLFEAPDFTSWNYRMKTAKQLKSVYTKNLDLIPLAPLEKAPPFIIGSLDAVLNPSTRELDITISGNIPSRGRAWGIMVVNDTKADNFDDIVLLRGDSTDSNPQVIHTSSLHDFDFNANTWMRVCTIDDVDSAVDMAMSQALRSQSSPKPTEVFDTTVSNVSVSNGTVKVRFVQPFEAGDATVTVASYRAIVNFAYVNGIPQNARLVNDNGFFALEFEQQNYTVYSEVAFGASCNIDLTGITVETADKYIIAEQIVLPLVETAPEARLVQASVNSVSCEQDVLIVEINTPSSGEYWAAGNKEWLSRNNGIERNEEWAFTKYQTASQLASNLFELRAAAVIPAGWNKLSYGYVTLLAQSYVMPSVMCQWNGVTYKLDIPNIDCSLLQWQVDIVPEFVNEEATSHVFDFVTNAKDLSGYTYGSTSATANYSTNERGISANMPETCAVGTESKNGKMAFYGVAPAVRKAAKIGCFSQFVSCPCAVGNTVYNYKMLQKAAYTNNVDTVEVDIENAAFLETVKAILERTTVEGWEQWKEEGKLEIGWLEIGLEGYGTWSEPDSEDSPAYMIGNIESADGDEDSLDAQANAYSNTPKCTYEITFDNGDVPASDIGNYPWAFNIEWHFIDDEVSGQKAKIINLVSGSTSVKYVCNGSTPLTVSKENLSRLPTEVTGWQA